VVIFTHEFVVGVLAVYVR